MKTKAKVIFIACSIFKNEIIEILKTIPAAIEVKFLSSMLHMKPREICKKLQQMKSSINFDAEQVCLIYGDCCPEINNLENENGVVRTEGINCIEIILGSEKYRKLRKEGVFFLMPEWTLRWEEVFKFELLLEGEVAKEFMQDFHTKIIYLDNGIINIPYEHIKEIENYTGLKVETMPTDKNFLKRSLLKKLKELENEDPLDNNQEKK